MTLDQIINTRLSDIIISNYKAVDLFEKYNFNYCLKGNSTLGKICQENNIQPEKIAGEFKNMNSIISDHMRFSEWTTDLMCDYIITNHHSYIKKMFPLMIRSAIYLGKRGVINSEISEMLRIMHYDFMTHLQKEEKFIFPQLRKISECELKNEKYDMPPFGSISNPVKVMSKEHEIAYENFSDIKKICENFETDRTFDERKFLFYRSLREFEIDMHLHFHFENNLLFPKAIKTEKKLLKNNSKKYFNRIKKSKNE